MYKQMGNRASHLMSFPLHMLILGCNLKKSILWRLAFVRSVCLVTIQFNTILTEIAQLKLGVKNCCFIKIKGRKCL